MQIPVSVLVLHNVYGAPSDFSPATAQVIPSLVRKAVCWPEEPFVVWGSGDQGRAFVHVDDVVDALVLARQHGYGHGPIQIGPSVCTTIRGIAEAVVRVSGKPIEIHYDTSKPEGDRGRRADFSKATALLGWEPRVDLESGLESLYRWIEGRIGRSG
jgi:GDP-D-mannose 3',5'-epimerase